MKLSRGHRDCFQKSQLSMSLLIHVITEWLVTNGGVDLTTSLLLMKDLLMRFESQHLSLHLNPSEV